MTTSLTCRALMLSLATVSAALVLIAVFHAWLEPSLALALMDGLSLCR